MKPAYMMALALIVVSLGVTLYTFSFSIAPHVTITQVMNMPGQQVQVPGKIIKDTVTFDTTRGELQFDIQEMKGPNRLSVVYREPKPENFDSATSVEAVGVYRDGKFHAKNLLVKCPSKYNDKPQSSDNSSGLFIVAGTLGLGTAVVAIPLLFNRGKTWS